jgi:hypothetical protein
MCRYKNQAAAIVIVTIAAIFDRGKLFTARSVIADRQAK